MAKITLNNTNSKCPYCEIKEYVNAVCNSSPTKSWEFSYRIGAKKSL
ncbi:Uncharacterised protein [Campylobacter jejuni subsp. doylei]|nr:Uncharacterised protein [Campylobacter jejuni subsp. doylei]